MSNGELTGLPLYEAYVRLGVYSDSNALPWVGQLTLKFDSIRKALGHRLKDRFLVLDIGTGASACLFWATKYFASQHVLSVDVDRNSILLSRDRMRALSIPPRSFGYLQSDAKTLALGDSCRGVVCCVLTVHHLSRLTQEYKDKARAFLEIGRVCAVDGYVVILDSERDFKDIWRHSDESIRLGRVSFVSRQAVEIFLQRVFPNSSVSVISFPSGGTPCFLITMHKRDGQEFNEAERLLSETNEAKEIVTREKEEVLDQLREMLAEL